MTAATHTPKHIPVLIDDVLAGLAHAHVERPVLRKGEPALGLVELH